MSDRSLLTELSELIKGIQGPPSEETRRRVTEIRMQLHGKKAIVISKECRLPGLMGTIDTNNYRCSDVFMISYEERVVSHYMTKDGIKTVEKTAKGGYVVHPEGVELVD